MIHLWLEVTVSGDYWLENTIHMDTIHSVIALAPASFTSPSFYLSQKITLCWATEWSIILCLANAQNIVLCTLFYMNTANKGKGKLFLCSWRWHVQGGTALQQFLIVASDVGEWSDILCCNHFSIRKRTLGTIVCEVGLAPEPVWMFCRSEKSSELTRNLSWIV